VLDSLDLLDVTLDSSLPLPVAPQDANELPSSQNTITSPAGAHEHPAHKSLEESRAAKLEPTGSTTGSWLLASAGQTLFRKSIVFQKDDSEAAGGQFFDFILYGSL
jgi:hypothetical protein